jgi:hypothetical protein
MQSYKDLCVYFSFLIVELVEDFTVQRVF